MILVQYILRKRTSRDVSLLDSLIVTSDAINDNTPVIMSSEHWLTQSRTLHGVKSHLYC